VGVDKLNSRFYYVLSHKLGEYIIKDMSDKLK